MIYLKLLSLFVFVWFSLIIFGKMRYKQTIGLGIPMVWSASVVGGLLAFFPEWFF